MNEIPAGEFTWTAAGAWASFLALLGIIVRQVGPWRKQSIDAETTFRDGLITRVERLEKILDNERLERERERARHNAERSLDRHRINNLQQCFDAMLLMIEAAPEKASEIIVKIKEMRRSQLAAEVAEKAAIHVAEFDATRDLT